MSDIYQHIESAIKETGGVWDQLNHHLADQIAQEPDQTSGGLGMGLWPPMGIQVMLSVPPATTTSENPHMIFSAAMAMD